MWRVVGASVRGTSHDATGAPCQDFSDYRQVFIGNAPALIIGIADGAGSVQASDIGAREAVSYLMRKIPAAVRDVRAVNKSIAREWLVGVRDHLASVAATAAVEFDQLACTLLAAIITEDVSVFIQVGDGTWVVQEDAHYRCATWPVKGEFANQTTFITSPRWADVLQCEQTSNHVSGIAGFTDGLQAVALQLSSSTAHAPFFDLMFNAVRSGNDEPSLKHALAQFLSSDAINERTDDDKSLVLACWHDLKLLSDVV